MKKGLILALMVGLGIMAGPVMAEAPVFTELPKVIIGNTEDITSAGNTVWRFIDAVDLNSVVDWKNPSFTSSTHRAYWSDANNTTGIDVQVSGTGSFTDSLTSADLAGLAGGTPPPGTAEILGNGANNWLSLMNLTATASTPPHAYLSNAEIDTYGVTNDAASVAGALNDYPSSPPAVLTLIAAVTSGTTQVMPSQTASLEVYNMMGVGDQTTRTLAYFEYPVSSVDGVSGWYWAPQVASTWITPATKSAEPTVGFDIAATDDPTALNLTFFGEWQMADGGTLDSIIYPANAGGMSGKLFNTRLRLSNSSAPSAQLCPSYRILYANIAFTHIGGLQVTTTHDLGAPSAGNDFVAQLFWEIPEQATESADGGNLATYPFPTLSVSEHPDRTGTSYEWRDYTILFNSFHGPGQTGDFGTLSLVEVAMEIIDAPTVADSTVSYSNLSSWLGIGLNQFFPTLFADGSATIGASSITLLAGTDSSLSFRLFQVNPLQVTPIQGNLADHMALTDNRLVRFSYSAQSQSVATTPVVRVFLHATSSDGADITAGTSNLNFNWEDEYGAALDFVKPTTWNITTVIAGYTNPGVPTATATTFSTWIYTHSGFVAGNYILPDFSVFSKNNYATGATQHGWSDDAGGVSLSAIQVQEFSTW